MPIDTTTCQGTTKAGRQCSRAAGAGGYCYQHRPAAAAEAPALTEKQRRFVEAYMGEAAGNATEAARIAGYTGDDVTLRVTAHENLTKPNIREAIESRIDADPLVATRFDRQRFWSRVMAGKELDGDKPAQMRDRLKASELLARSQGDFVERVEHTGKDGAPIQLASGVDLSSLTGGELADLEGLLEKLEDA